MQKIILFIFFIISTPVFANTSNANWMGQIPNERILNRLIIPGTHDSGTSNITDKSRFSLTKGDALPQWLEAISNILPKSIVSSISAAWAKTQPLSITDQLNSGIRYIDLRVCNIKDKNNINTFYICHTQLSSKLSTTLKHISTFAQSHPSEILLLDFNHLYNIDTTEDKSKLMQQLNEQLSQLAIPNTYSPTDTIGKIRESKRNIIILIDSNLQTNNPKLGKFISQDIWAQSTINSPWLDSSTLPELKKKLDQEIAFRAQTYQSNQQFFVTQAIKTENTTQVIDGILQPNKYPASLQHYEQTVDIDLIAWLNSYIAAYGYQPINIVIQDWFTKNSRLIALAKQYDTETPLPHHDNHTMHNLLNALKRSLHHI